MTNLFFLKFLKPDWVKTQLLRAERKKINRLHQKSNDNKRNKVVRNQAAGQIQKASKLYNKDET